MRNIHALIRMLYLWVRHPDEVRGSKSLHMIGSAE